MACEYCFYTRDSLKREEVNKGKMSLDTLKTTVRRLFEETRDRVDIVFQGGEPMLAGIDFYRSAMQYIKEYNVNNIPYTVSVQTNATLINEEWCALFAQNDILIGVSLDGNKAIHSALRRDIKGKDTFNTVLKSIELLKKHSVRFNILTVVTSQIAKHIESVYNFYRKSSFSRIQFITVVDDTSCSEKWSLSAEEYYTYLNTLFSLWSRDILNGEDIYIRDFNAVIDMMLYRVPTTCEMMGVCNMQNVIEANGDTYPCDFYTGDEYLCGNINDMSFRALFDSSVAKGFINNSVNQKNPQCKGCEVYALCAGGCRRMRDNSGKFKYCNELKRFYLQNAQGFVSVARKIAAGKR